MKDYKVMPVNSINIQKILASQELTDKQKAAFIRNNVSEIKDVMKSEITEKEFVMMMHNRPLIKFRPLKNSFTKKGDKILLAKTLGIQEKDVNAYIKNIIDTNFDIRQNINASNIEEVKAYVYRHGTKSQVCAFLEYELSDVKNVLQRLYKTLDDNSGGLCDYFSRPIHRMDNITLGKLYNTIDKSLRCAAKSGFITDDECNSTAEWALVRIYQIQNNSKLIKALDTYNSLIN